MTSPAASRFGVVADVHANLQALERVLAFLEDEGVETIWCLGDVVGYGGDPSPCLELVRERCAGTVRGNHDAAVVDPSRRDWFNHHARAAIERHAGMLDDDELAWLDSLPPTIERERFSLGHGGFADPAAFTYVTNDRLASLELDALETSLGAIGHTHVPAAWRRTAGGVVESRPARGDTELAIGDESGWLVNPGAVGQPRDRDPRAACGVVDLDDGSFRIVRLEYDVEGAAEAILAAGLPPFEAERIRRGV